MEVSVDCTDRAEEEVEVDCTKGVEEVAEERKVVEVVGATTGTGTYRAEPRRLVFFAH
jgi:hypothetical protein